MNKKIEQIQGEIAQTKTDLTEKLGKLEGQLRHDASIAKENVEQAIHKFQTATKVFSLRHQIRERPLIVIGASVLSGFVISRWLTAPRSPRVIHHTPNSEKAPQGISERFPKETAMVKSAVVSFLFNFLASKATESMPHLVDMIVGMEGTLRSKPNSKKE